MATVPKQARFALYAHGSLHRIGRVQIRQAAPADAVAIDRLVQRAYEPYVARIGMRPGPMDHDYREKVEKCDVFVAVDDDLVGVLVLVPLPDHVLLENVAVDPARQGEGIGGSLLAFAEARAKEIQKPTLRLYTHTAMTENIALYLRLGYEERERRSEAGFSRAFFVKQL